MAVPAETPGPSMKTVLTTIVNKLGAVAASVDTMQSLLLEKKIAEPGEFNQLRGNLKLIQEIDALQQMIAALPDQ
jgi:hypothetical protein